MNQFILYIQDDPNNSLLLGQLAVAEGHTLGSANGAVEAWDKAVQMWPDLIILDQRCLGVSDSVYLMRRFKTDQRFYKVPIILLVPPGNDRPVAGDADLLLTGPFCAASVRNAIRQFLDQPAAPIFIPRRQSRPKLWPQALTLATGL